MTTKQADPSKFCGKLCFPPFEIDAPKQALLRDGRDLKLTPQNFTVLKVLVEKAILSPRTPLSNAEIRRHSWPSTSITEASVREAVRQIRKALGDVRPYRYIQCRNRVGYWFDAPVIAEQVNPKAYQHYRIALHLRSTPVEQELLNSIIDLKQAIACEPRWPAPYAALGDSYLLLAVGGFRPSTDCLGEAKNAAATALRLNNQCAEAHAVLGAVMAFEYKWDSAQMHCEQAIRLNPGYVTAHHIYAIAVHAPAGRFQEAQQSITCALAMEPTSAFLATVKAIISYYARNWHDALEHCECALRLDRHYALAYWCQGLTHLACGTFLDAIVSLKRAVHYSQESPRILASLAHAYSTCDDTLDEHSALIGRLEHLKRCRFVSPYEFAVAKLGTDHPVETIRKLDLARRQRHPAIIHLGVDPRFDRLREHPTFRKLLDLIGFSDSKVLSSTHQKLSVT